MHFVEKSEQGDVSRDGSKIKEEKITAPTFEYISVGASPQIWSLKDRLKMFK